jgi:hypothetical protein
MNVEGTADLAGSNDRSIILGEIAVEPGKLRPIFIPAGPIREALFDPRLAAPSIK